MINLANKKAIVCDLDGTLAESKSVLAKDMAEVLTGVLKSRFLVVVSGGSFAQFQKQFISQFSCPPELMQNLSLFPTNGSTCYKFNLSKNDWEQIYDEPLTEEQRKRIISALNGAILQLGWKLPTEYGEIVEDRRSQVTFSGCGQQAPVAVKQAWDPDQSKRRQVIEIIKPQISEFEIRMGGMTSIDITRLGVDKAYAIGKIKEILKVSDEDIIYVGDALYEGGNDEAVKKTAVDWIQVGGPQDTMKLFSQII